MMTLDLLRSEFINFRDDAANQPPERRWSYAIIFLLLIFYHLYTAPH